MLILWDRNLLRCTPSPSRSSLPRPCTVRCRFSSRWRSPPYIETMPFGLVLQLYSAPSAWSEPYHRVGRLTVLEETAEPFDQRAGIGSTRGPVAKLGSEVDPPLLLSSSELRYLARRRRLGKAGHRRTGRRVAIAGEREAGQARDQRFRVVFLWRGPRVLGLPFLRSLRWCWGDGAGERRRALGARRGDGCAHS